MSWQLLIIGYLVLGTAAYLLRRSLAQSLAEHNRLINAFFFVCVLYPLGLLVAAFSSPNLHIGWLNFVFLLGGSLIFPLFNILAFKANETVDAGLYTILNNLTPIVAIVFASLLLREGLNSGQLLGAFIIIFSAFLATLPKLKRGSSSSSVGLVYALVSVTILGLAIVYERWMLTRVDYGAYLIFGWGSQTLWMAILAWPERKNIKLLKTKKNFYPVLSYGLTNAFKGLCFVSALRVSHNASLVSAFSSFLAVLVVIAAYFILKERDSFWLKVIAVIIGTVGLIILNIA